MSVANDDTLSNQAVKTRKLDRAVRVVFGKKETYDTIEKEGLFRFELEGKIFSEWCLLGKLNDGLDLVLGLTFFQEYPAIANLKTGELKFQLEKAMEKMGELKILGREKTDTPNIKRETPTEQAQEQVQLQGGAGQAEEEPEVQDTLQGSIMVVTKAEMTRFLREEGVFCAALTVHPRQETLAEREQFKEEQFTKIADAELQAIVREHRSAFAEKLGKGPCGGRKQRRTRRAVTHESSRNTRGRRDSAERKGGGIADTNGGDVAEARAKMGEDAEGEKQGGLRAAHWKKENTRTIQVQRGAVVFLRERGRAGSTTVHTSRV
eukprot:m.291367 g.291367  ORF g.291367 m.291367 type:complete len:321 (+) comp22957_c0_seq2:897-1859(+)